MIKRADTVTDEAVAPEPAEQVAPNAYKARIQAKRDRYEERTSPIQSGWSRIGQVRGVKP